MIKVDKVRTHGYTTLIDYNSGEGQVGIVLSPGQDGKTPILAYDAQIDGGMELWLSGSRDENLLVYTDTCYSAIYDLLALHGFSASDCERVKDSIKRSFES
jgi:hypothetical protein